MKILKKLFRSKKVEKSNLILHAERELEFLRTGDEMNEMMRDNLLELVRVFAAQGHSGFSAGYLVSHLKPLLSFEPVGPLKGTANEWYEVGDGVWQNNRCGRVFAKGPNGEGAYDIDGVIFEEPNGSCFTCDLSRVDVVFPYTPKKVYAKVSDDSERAERIAARDAALAAG